MVFKRSRLDIYIDILRTINKGTHKPTHIMYHTNLSWKPLMQVLDAMIKQNLIITKKRGKNNLYDITVKGKNTLNYFNEALNLIEIQ